MLITGDGIGIKLAIITHYYFMEHDSLIQSGLLSVVP